MRGFITAAILVFSCLTAFSQITLEQSAYKHLLDSGYDIHHWVQEEGIRFDLGTLGATDNVYDLSAFKFNSEPVEVRFSDPAGTPYAEKFADATHVHHSITARIFHYYQLQHDGFNDLMYFLTLGEKDIYMKYVPPRPQLKFPLTIGTSWEWESEKLSVDLSIQEAIQFRKKSEVVAAGTLITPAGKRECLVIKDHSSKDIYLSDRMETTRYVSYRLIDKQGLGAKIGIDKSDADSTTPRILHVQYTDYPADKFGSRKNQDAAAY